MMRRRVLRRSGALLIAFCLAFAQVAMAAFAPPATPAMAQAMSQAMAAGDECHEEDPAGRHACIKKNCHEDAQKRDVPALDLPPAPLRQALRVDAPRDDGSNPREVPGSLLARATSPPAVIAFARRLE